uniref:Uncharacterized protein n=1 Tax=Ciona savignyi TaxID=51511 RepID=H2Z246_CIOSA
MFHNVHHVRFCVKNVEKFSTFLIIQLNFKKYAIPKVSGCTLRSKTVVLRHAEVIFIIDEWKKGPEPCCQDIFCHRNNNYPVDTACDVCLQTTDIAFILQKSRSRENENSPVETNFVKDEDGVVHYAIIKSPVGNLQHTLLNLSNYSGDFLPGFTVIKTWNADSNPNFVTAIDHIAFALNL